MFDRETILDALKRHHSLKAGVWAVIHVLESALHVRPKQAHSVRAERPVRFVVEPLRCHGSGQPPRVTRGLTPS
ncbi:DUF1971 domain-containing protein [Pseudochelatococcus sp. B33]